MAPREHEQAELLDRYWSELAGDASAPSPAGLEPALAALARRLETRLRPPEPDGAFASRLREALMREWAASPRRKGATAASRRRPWALGGLAAAVAAILLLLRLAGGPGGLVPAPGWPPARATSGPILTAAPGATAMPGAPGAAPMPDWLQTERLVASDQGVTLAYLRAIIHEPRFVILFLAIGREADGARVVPVDLRVLDQDGRELPYSVTWLENTGGITVGTLTLRATGPASTLLRLRVSEMLVEDPGSGETRSLRGDWDVTPIRRYDPAAPINPDRLAELDGVQCFRAGAVTIANHCYVSCAAAVAPTPPNAPTPTPLESAGTPGSPAVPPTEAPVATLPAAATPAPLENADTPEWPTQPPAVPPTEALPAEGPQATVTPVVGCDFTDWEHGVFGTTLVVSGPTPHGVYVLIARETGEVRQVAEEEFVRARQAAR